MIITKNVDVDVQFQTFLKTILTLKRRHKSSPFRDFQAAFRRGLSITAYAKPHLTTLSIGRLFPFQAIFNP